MTENTENILEWHRRYAIAIGTAKGLRFLHEECRGGPIIHRDLRPSNILLTHDYVPMVNQHILIQTRRKNVRIIGQNRMNTDTFELPHLFLILQAGQRPE